MALEYMMHQDYEDFTEACANGNITIVSDMIKWGLNYCDAGLAAACRRGHMDVALLMIDNEAVNFNYGFTKACENGHYDLAYHDNKGRYGMGRWIKVCMHS